MPTSAKTIVFYFKTSCTSKDMSSSAPFVTSIISVSSCDYLVNRLDSYVQYQYSYLGPKHGLYFQFLLSIIRFLSIFVEKLFPELCESVVLLLLLSFAGFWWKIHVRTPCTLH